MSRPRFEWKYVTTGRMIDNKTGKIFDTKDECLCLLNDLERQLEEAEEENLILTSFYLDLCERLPKGSYEVLGHGIQNVEKYIRRRTERIVKLKEKGNKS